MNTITEETILTTIGIAIILFSIIFGILIGNGSNISKQRELEEVLCKYEIEYCTKEEVLKRVKLNNKESE